LRTANSLFNSFCKKIIVFKSIAWKSQNENGTRTSFRMSAVEPTSTQEDYKSGNIYLFIVQTDSKQNLVNHCKTFIISLSSDSGPPQNSFGNQSIPPIDLFISEDSDLNLDSMLSSDCDLEDQLKRKNGVDQGKLKCRCSANSNNIRPSLQRNFT
jgi:hypothetical protein